MPDLFDQNLQDILKQEAPLADRMRPRNFEEFVGQEEIVGQGKLLRRAIENDQLFSMIFWGPPGSGKTSLAKIIANLTKSVFILLSAVSSGLDDLREVIRQAEGRRKFNNQRTILFIDEVHRWNKAQQDALLPFVEKGILTFIGATTENPSFEVISPLLSRSRVFVLQQLQPAEIEKLIKNALKNEERGLGKQKIILEPEALQLLIDSANGDGRIVLNGLEIAAKCAENSTITFELMKEVLQQKTLLYDRQGDEHYNVISAFIKSLRGSDPDAALYWLARMLEAGDDPLFISRRMVIFASEDIGNADPQALGVAVACMQAAHFVGMPEARINLAQTTTYLATAPKSNASYTALLAAEVDVKKTLNLPVPLHLRNAPTDLMKKLGYGKDYQYPHDFPNAKVKQEYLPKELKGRKYYKFIKK